MVKTLLCRDIGVDCDGKISAETEEELMKKVAEHAKTVHGISEISPEMAKKVKAAIKETCC